MTIAPVVARGEKGEGRACWEGSSNCWSFPFPFLGLVGGLLFGVGVLMVVGVGGVLGCWFATVEGPVDGIHHSNHNLAQRGYAVSNLGCHSCDFLL